MIIEAALLAFALHSGDRVAFYGDSITEFGNYTNPVESFIVTRYPSLKVEFFNVGWAGDTSWGQYGWDGAGGSPEDRVRLDLTPLKPTVVTVMLGMNDSGYVPYEAKIEKVFREAYGKLVANIAHSNPQARINLIRSSPWDDFSHPKAFVEGVQGDAGGYNAVVARYGEAVVHALATEKKYPYLDFNQPLADAVTAAAKIDPKLAQQMIPDRIHPGPAGGLVLAKTLVESWGFSPLVSSVTLDAASKSVVSQSNCLVHGFDGRSWTQTDGSLPLPVDWSDKLMKLGADVADLAAIDRQVVRVRNLPAGNYRLVIDGKSVLETTAETLESGVDLTGVKTPMLDQALQVADLTAKKNHLFFIKWREIERPFPHLAGTAKAAAALEVERQEVRAERDKAAQPKAHRFSLVAA